MVNIDTQKCIGCGKCIADCVGYNITMDENGKAQIKRACIECGHCIAVCPQGCFSIDSAEQHAEKFSGTKIDANQLLSAIKERRSIRQYKSDKLTDEQLTFLRAAIKHTATAKNVQGTKFVFVQNELEQFKDLLWSEIDKMVEAYADNLPDELKVFAAFSRRRKRNANDDFLFRNAPCVIFISSNYHLDAGLAAQNIEHMAQACGLGVLFNGYLEQITDRLPKAKEWLGLAEKKINGCLLIGQADVKYVAVPPRKEPDITIK